MNRIILLITASTLFANSVIAQTTSKEESIGNKRFIAPGEMFPDLMLNEIENFSAKRIRFNELKGKWIVLDFWSEWCGSCLKSLPKMNEIQKEFAGVVQLFMVGTYLNTKTSNLKTTKLLFNKITKRYNLDLSVAYDNELANALNVRLLPDIVIIDPNGIVRSRTSEITISALRNLINGNDISSDLYPDNSDIDRRNNQYKKKLPLLIDGNGGSDTSFIFRSLIIPDNIMTPISREISEKGRLEIISAPLANLYKLAFYGHYSWNMRTKDVYGDSISSKLYGNYYSEPFFEIKDSTKYITKSKTEKRYSYSLIYPIDGHSFNNTNYSLAMTPFLREKMQKDLYTCFGFNVKTTIKNMPYYRLLAKKVKVETVRSKGKKFTFSKPAGRYQGIKYTGCSISDIIMYLTIDSYGYDSKIPIIDETGILDKVDIELKGTTFEELCTSLKKYGFEIVLDKRPMTCLVISDIE